VKIDFHVHTAYSLDSSNDPLKVGLLAEAKGLDYIAITDHNTIKGALKALNSKYSEHIILGEEILTDRGEVIGLFLRREIKPGKLSRVISEIRDQGGIVMLPHPFDSFRGKALRPAKSDSKYFDLVEGFNSRCLLQRFNLKAQRYAMLTGLKMTAGSDAHHPFEIGNAYVEFRCDDPREALYKEQGRIFGVRTQIYSLPASFFLSRTRKILRALSLK